MAKSSEQPRRLSPAKLAHTGKRYTVSDRRNKLQAFETLLKKGVSARKIAEQLGTSVATLYRWRQETPFSGRYTPLEPKPNVDHISSAIQALTTDASPLDLWGRVRAACEFAIWLRWPTLNRSRSLALTAFIASYLRQKSSSDSLADVPAADLQSAAPYISLRDIASLLDPEAELPPLFDDDKIPGKTFAVSDVLAEFAFFFLAQPESGVFEPTKQGLYNAFAAEALRYNWSLGESSFNKLWQNRASTLPFLFVDRRYADPSWALNPTDATFSQDLDLIIRDLTRAREYFGRCKWVSLQLLQTLPKATARANPFPVFPDHLPAVACVVEPLPNALMKASTASHEAVDAGQLDAAIRELEDKERSMLGSPNRAR